MVRPINELTLNMDSVDDLMRKLSKLLELAERLVMESRSSRMRNTSSRAN